MGTSSGSPIPLFKLKVANHGRIKDIKQLVARIEGLPDCLNGQLVDMGDGVRGMVMGFNEQDVLVLVMGDESHLRLGKSVTGINEPLQIPVGPGFIGRMVTALGDPCDNLDPIPAAGLAQVLRDSPPITARATVSEFLPTGSKVVDFILPLAKGQRQLILGDRVTGKTVLTLDAIMRQKGSGCICIFCAIGKSRTAIQKTVTMLRDAGALEYTIIMVAADSAPPGEQYLAPFSAAAMGEYFVSQGRDVLVVFDDLTKHAWAYRQLSLLLDRSPGREAYPGDIFYVQAQLMERAGRFNAAHGGGSMTFLGIAETLQGDLTGYIPSNLAAMSDGQICLSSGGFAEGQRPAVDVMLSLSIVGRRAQPPILRRFSEPLRARLAQYYELVRLGALQAGLASASTRAMRGGAAIQAILQQREGHPVSLAEEVLLLYGLASAAFAERAPERIAAFRDEIYPFVRRLDADLIRELEAARDLNADLESRLERAVGAYFSRAA
ncbi:MAG: F0F1 ATP synthase subunit alpha [Lentisphaerae bacterium]|nr:F0F1 ATP synthase subunit alpha [Lentisphaerota bacterium]